MMDHRRKIKRFSPCVPATRRIAVLLLAGLLSFAAGGETSEDQDVVRVRRVAGPGYVSLVVENRRAYDVTVTLTIELKNAQVMRIVPETAAYSGHAQVEAARISPFDPSKPYRWYYDLRWAKGAMNVEHEDAVRYRLPFPKGETHRVSQGREGGWTHHGPDRHAVDFSMPEGTTVCAARDGVVVDLQESWKTGGPSKTYQEESNYVSIAHADGTIAEYHHLKYEGVLVEIGAHITAGQPIGRSGNTGYSTFPHLHFGVYSALDGSHRQSHRLTFVTRQGIITELRARRAYTAE